MPWFLTSICSRETTRKIYEREPFQSAVSLPNRMRCFGFYNSHREAAKAAEENRCNMCECLYDYLVIEYIEEGIHPMVHVEEWYIWNDLLNRWVYLNGKPMEFQGIINFALG